MYCTVYRMRKKVAHVHCTEGGEVRSSVLYIVQEEGKLCSRVLYSTGVRRGELIVLYTLQEEGEVSFCVLYIVQYIRKE